MSARIADNALLGAGFYVGDFSRLYFRKPTKLIRIPEIIELIKTPNIGSSLK
jgi:hypothetical protein